ncbi:N-acetylmuramoyl-L-alanine amidase [Natranaerovirga pectinivora]|uniref:N-acetylmuramoyl-L-alanine amidase n=1 Tax=Natranaerovirga pectinivora TaxID=682400 RepID=A0A4R3MMC7_9FIRM|nr:N-acetylmuramoyl-L-alanine amidase [Natranaerovirga pectinivora]TCT15405.1 N-acetylmuramoyl-L-alanine amidase [Natranaerovirga pectinivora]
MKNNNLSVILIGVLTLVIVVLGSLVYVFQKDSVMLTSNIYNEVDSQLNWVNDSAIVIEKRLESVNDNKKYKIKIKLPTINIYKWIEVSWVEYKIISEEDKIKVHYIYDNNGIEYFQLIRDDIGKLIFDDTRPIIVLDAGHGGMDRGGGSNNLWDEKDMVLKITLKQRDLLKDSDIRVILTRDEDEYITLFDRCAIINYIEPEILISNHINRFNGTAKGIEVIYNRTANVEFAWDLANALSTHGIDVFRVWNRKDDSFTSMDYYALHKYTYTNSYILEYGFADNERDAKIITDKWEDMAKTVVKMIENYFE